ncbi:uncharacterized protein LOC144149795 [Haemaphysalis longicornis]
MGLTLIKPASCSKLYYIFGCKWQASSQFVKMRLLLVSVVLAVLAAQLQGSSGQNNPGDNSEPLGHGCPSNPDMCRQYCFSKGALSGVCTDPYRETCWCQYLIPHF